LRSSARINKRIHKSPQRLGRS